MDCALPAFGGILQSSLVTANLPGLRTAQALSVMTVEITVGNDTIDYTQPWQQKAYGWYLPHR